MSSDASGVLRFFKRYLFTVLMLLAGLVKGQVPVASFTVSASQGCKPLNVQFTNTSQNATSYQWSFGNGNTSTQTNPANVFTNPGSYTVTLTANGPGGSNSTTQTITVVPSPVSDFSANPLTACQGYGVIQFTNNSSNFDSCVWDFGDGTFSSLASPKHIYNISGTFNVSLVTYNKGLACSNVKTLNAYITVLPQPSVLVTTNATETCDAGFNFQFNNNAVNAASWAWTFGDTQTSPNQNPSHVYTDTGYFNVKVIITSNNGCIDTGIYNNYIHIKYNPKPNIAIDNDSGCAPHYTSIIAPYKAGVSYFWNFGDTTTGTGNAAYHHFYYPGSYHIDLQVDYGNGCLNHNSFDSIVVFPSPKIVYTMTNYVGCAPLTVNFLNYTTGNFNYKWDFGDGDSSTAYSPTHTYTSAGSYQVSLTGYNTQGCSQGYPLSARVTTFDPIAAFSPDVSVGCPPLTVNFNNVSQGTTSWLWNFGDGDTSTQKYPTHIYNNSGVYTVTLIASNSTGCRDTFVYSAGINVNQPVLNFVPPPAVTACAPHSANFADASAASAWLWDFGDGDTSTLANPSHTFSEPGTYTVGLTTWMNGGCSTHINNFQTFIIDGAEPDFSYTVSSCPPYIVTFHDSSLNASSWNWSFGDGGSSALQNPVHTFPNTGSYNITLEVTTAGGCSTTLQANGGVQITGLGSNATMVVADTIAPIDVLFHANSTNATWWIWSFGDGDSAFTADPPHTFAGLGPYSVSLTIGNDSCQFTYDYPEVKFGSSGQGTFELGGPDTTVTPLTYHCAPYTVQYANPYPDAMSIKWIFGDGTTSNSNSPLHAFNQTGSFLTILIVTDSSGAVDSLVFSDTIRVVKPVTDFNISTQNTCSAVIVNVNTTQPTISTNWNFGNGNTAVTPSASVLYPNTNASYVISLNSVDTNHCSSYVAKSFSVNVNDPITVSKRKSCAGDTLSFGIGNMNYASYLWNFGDGGTSNVKNPQHAFQDSGYYHVTLVATDINGCATTFTLSSVIEVFDPIASFTYLTPTSNCIATSVQFTNTCIGSDTWLWTFGDGGSSTSFSPQHTYYVLGYHDVTLTAFKNVCKSTITIPNLIYNANLSADFSYTYDRTCSPATAVFTDLSVDAAKWVWDFGDGGSSSLQNPVHIYTKAPKGSIILTVTDVNGCAKTVTKAAPIITEARIYLVDSAGCNPFTTTFTDSSSNAISWQWNFGDNVTSALQNPSHTYTADGIYTVELIVEASSGCFDTLRVDSVISVGTAMADFTADSISGCVPLVTNFTDLSLTTTKWAWDFGDGGTSSLQNPSHIYTSPGVYTVILVVENRFGCKDTIIKQQYVTVKGSVPYFTPSGINGCEPFSVTFTDSSSGAIGWYWNFGDGTHDTLVNPVHVYINSGNYTVSLYTTDSSGCATIYTMPQPIVVSPVIHAAFTTADLGGCSPYTVHLDNSGTSVDSLIWDMGDGHIIYGNNPDYTYTQGGTYYITLIAKNTFGCTDTFHFAQPIEVSQQPTAGFMQDLTKGCSPVSVQFLNISELLYNPTFHWDFGTGDTSDEENPAYVFNADGIFTVSLTVTNAGGCASTYEVPAAMLVYDQTPPPPTSLYRVTVNDDHEVELNWHLSLLRDMNYYVVYKYNPLSSAYDSIAKVDQANLVTNATIPTYIDYNVSTLSNTYQYKVQAVDMCFLRQPLSALKEHGTMDVESTAGNMKVDVSWSPYLGCDFSSYEIYRRDNLSGPFQRIASVDTSMHAFTDTTAWCPIPYTYKIMARSICAVNEMDSWSDTTGAHPSSDVSEQMVDVVRSTVVDNRYVLTEWKEPALFPYMVDRYNIFRSTDKVDYKFIASVPAVMHEFSDYEADVQQQEYYYKVEVQNVCSIATQPGNINSSILLQVESTEVTHTLKWTKYFDWDTGVDRYVIEKQDINGNWQEVRTVDAKVTEWEEE